MVAFRAQASVVGFTQAASDSHPATAALRDSIPVIATLAPLGLALGAAIADSPLPAATGWMSSPLIYGASAQLAAVSMLGAGASGAAVVATVGIINARSLFYSAGLRRLFHGQPRWFRLFGPYLLVDPLFALVTSHGKEFGSVEAIRRYYLTAGLAIWFTWMPLVAAGMLLGPALPAAATLRFAMPALLLSLLAPSIKGSPALAAAVVAAGIVLVAGSLGGLSLLLAAAAGAATGLLVESKRP